MEHEHRKELLAELLEQSDGTRADDYAALTAEFDEMQEVVERQSAEISKLNEKNTLLKRENFRLFERVGTSRENEGDIGEDAEDDPEERRDYLKEVMDDKGFFK